MADNSKKHDDLLRLNALVDGELDPGERALLAARLATDREFARAHATLARLKAGVVESAEATPAFDLVLPAREPRRPALIMAAAAAVIGGLIVLVAAASLMPPREPAMRKASNDAAVVLAALPQAPVVPDLGLAGLRLEQTRVETAGDRRTVVAVYRGPRGCRLELRIQRADAAAFAGQGTERRSWSVGDLAYELVAFGMPSARFAAVADAAVLATQAGQLPDAGKDRLRQARVASGPCLG